MKLYLTCMPGQASAALGDFREQKVSYVTSNMVFPGLLRFDKKKEIWYVKGRTERVDITMSDVQMIVAGDYETKIITNL